MRFETGGRGAVDRREICGGAAQGDRGGPGDSVGGAAPRFHHQCLPDKLHLEPGFSDAARAGLQALGCTLSGGEPDDRVWSDGECMTVNPKTGVLERGRDRRHTYGKAAGR